MVHLSSERPGRWPGPSAVGMVMAEEPCYQVRVTFRLHFQGGTETLGNIRPGISGGDMPPGMTVATPLEYATGRL